MSDDTGIDRFLISGTDPDVVEHYHKIAQYAKDINFALFEEDVVVVDTETTGLMPSEDALIEIAAIRMSGPKIVDTFQSFVNPGRAIPEEISELTKITDDDVAGAPNPARAVADFANFASSSNLVAHNASFDRSFIMRQAKPGALPGTWIDTLSFSHIVFPHLKSHRLSDLSRMFNVHHSTHRAIDDAKALAALWRIMLAAAYTMPAGLAKQIAELCPEVPWTLRPIFMNAAAAKTGTHFNLRAARRQRIKTFHAKQRVDAKEISPKAPSAYQLKEAFSSDGIAGHMYPDYEQRDEQLAMALEVGDALRENRFSVLEAGTGVGKSMGYLLPFALMAKKNKITVGVATKTNTLMDQLVYHELPRLADALGGLRAVALKGYEHYLCLRKLELSVRQKRSKSETGSFSRGRELIEMLATLLNFAAQSSGGDLDEINLHWRSLPRAFIEANSADCLKRKCPYFPHLCFLHGARRQASSADIVVTNHALLFRDTSLDGGILPPIRYWVIDEAHAIETEARRQLSLEVSAKSMLHTLEHIATLPSSIAKSLQAASQDARAKHAAKDTDELGDAKYSQAASDKEDSAALLSVGADIENRVGALQNIASSFFSLLKELEPRARGKKTPYENACVWIGAKLRESSAWKALEAPGYSLVKKLDALIKILRDYETTLEQYEARFENQQSRLAGSLCSLEEDLLTLNTVLDGSNTSYVYSAQINRNPKKTGEALLAEKLDIGKILAEEFYPKLFSVIFSSATLATGSLSGPFKHFLHISGLDRLEPERVRMRVLKSSYDFEHNMKVFLPQKIPEPGAPGYQDCLADMLFELHCVMHGSVLTLFTNRREMETLYKTLKPKLQSCGLELRAQLKGTGTKILRDLFLANKSLSLFALRSFWEGFDAPGDTLRCVVIPKLPFARPSDPIARERDARFGREAWGRYSLPEAVMDTKQAAGRLIRKANDSGYLVLADARLTTRNYGRSFLRALPTHNIQILSVDAMIAAIKDELAQD